MDMHTPVLIYLGYIINLHFLIHATNVRVVKQLRQYGLVDSAALFALSLSLCSIDNMSVFISLSLVPF